MVRHQSLLLKPKSEEITNKTTVYDTEPLCATLINGKINDMGEMYEIMNSLKCVNGEISEMDEMYKMVNSMKWMKSGFCPGPAGKQKFSTSTLQKLSGLHISPVNSLVQLLS